MQKIALLFPGIGSEYVGMGKSFYENFAIARRTFDEASEALGFNLARQCFEGDLAELKKPVYSQPALLTVNMAIYRVYKQEIGINPVCCAGHSSGEISALACAGAIGFSEAVKLVHWCGRYIPKAVPPEIGLMALVSGIDPETVAGECSKLSQPDNLVVVSNYNSPDQIALSGHRKAVAQLNEILKKKKAVVVLLKASAPFHSPLMHPVIDAFKAEMDQYQYFPARFPVISNVDGLPYQDGESVPDKLLRQIAQPVQWQVSMEYIASLGVEAAIEMGPLPSLTNLMKKNAPSVATYSMHKTDDLSGLLRLVPGLAIVNTEFQPYRPEQTVVAIQHETLSEDEIKRCLFGMIREVFGNAEIAWDTSFYELGGDSILLLKFQAEVDRKFPGLVDVSDLFSYPTIEQLGEKIRMKLSGEKETLATDNRHAMDDILLRLAQGEITVEEAEQMIL